jgi:alpha-tubulin suppressor-like RCC1 family protein
VCGLNKYDQLCISFDNCEVDVSEEIKQPILLLKDQTIKQIICNCDNSMILRENGELWIFGNNADGKLLMTNPSIIGVNNYRFGHIIWSANLFKQLSKYTQSVIFTFLLVCNYYRVNYNVNMVKYMKHEVIKYLFY